MRCAIFEYAECNITQLCVFLQYLFYEKLYMKMYQKWTNYASIYPNMANCLFWRVALALVSHLDASVVIDNQNY